MEAAPLELPMGPVLIAMAVRGHRLPPDPLTWTREGIAADLKKRHQRAGARRFLSDQERSVVAGVVRSICALRGRPCYGLAVGPTCLMVVVRCPVAGEGGAESLANAWRPCVARRLRAVCRWHRRERVFTARARVAALDPRTADALAVKLELLCSDW